MPPIDNIIATVERQGTGFQPIPGAIRDVLSAEILYNALPQLRFDPFSTKRTELNTQPGNTIGMPRLGRIKRGGKLVEGERMKTQGMSMSMAYITVGERGNAIGMSELLLQTSFFDQMEMASFHLGRDMALVLDLELRDAALLTTNLVRGDGSTPGTAAGSRATIQGLFDTRVIKDAVEVLETNNAAKFDGDYYVAFIHPHQARGLRDDPDWVNAALYSGAAALFNGEIGRFEDVRFISTTVMPNGANSAVDPETNEYIDLGYTPTLDGAGATSRDLYQALIFGENNYGFALGLPAELRDNGITDFGREHALAWYSIWGADLLMNENVVIVETA
jgi:N4-gp56 family major capsid protein